MSVMRRGGAESLPNWGVGGGNTALLLSGAARHLIRQVSMVLIAVLIHLASRATQYPLAESVLGIPVPETARRGDWNWYVIYPMVFLFLLDRARGQVRHGKRIYFGFLPQWFRQGYKHISLAFYAFVLLVLHNSVLKTGVDTLTVGSGNTSVGASFRSLEILGGFVLLALMALVDVTKQWRRPNFHGRRRQHSHQAPPQRQAPPPPRPAYPPQGQRTHQPPPRVPQPNYPRPNNKRPFGGGPGR